MPSNSPLKVGFIGLSSRGWASDVLAPALTQPSLRDKYDLVAVSTTSEASAQASAQKYSQIVGHPVKAYHGSSSNIASDPEIDVVGVSVRVTHHKEVVLPVIEAKKDFWLEWPAGRNTLETKAMAEAARKHGVRSIIGFQSRYSAALQKVKELLASGLIGTVRSSHVVAHIGKELGIWPPVLREASEYGMLPLVKENGLTRLHVPIGHHLDMFTYLLGDFVSVSATDATMYPVGTFVDADEKPTGKTLEVNIPDHFAITGFLKSGAFVNLFWRDGYSSGPETGRRQFVWEIDGEDGTIRMEGNGLYGAFPGSQEPDLFLNGKKVEFQAGNPFLNVTAAWQEFAKGETGDYPTIDDAVKHHELLDAIELSAKEGRRIIL
ncbi:NAD-binding Rossmann fold oxidoreductase [Agrocybe pediades]|nr:NAD-binding Rossmann fold oxidoreductase [Agrocybe pediades]